MSEGRTPEATLAQQRQLNDDDISILHQIVLRAQNEAVDGNPRDALLNAYDQIFTEKNISRQHDQACFNIILQLLDPNVPGESLYHKFERILLDRGFELSFEDDEATTQRSLATIKSDDVLQTHAQLTPPYVTNLMQRAEAHDRRVLARQTFEALRTVAKFRQAERLAFQQAQRDIALDAHADQFYEDRLRRKVLKQLLALYEDHQHISLTADRHYECKLLGRVAGKAVDAYKVRKVRDMEDERLKGWGLYMWTLSSREAQFGYNQRQKLLSKYVQKLIEFRRENSAKLASLEQLLEQRDEQQRSALRSAALGMMAQKSAEVHRMSAAAEQYNGHALRNSALCSWKNHVRRIDEMNMMADHAFVGRFLSKCRSAAAFKRQRTRWLVTWTLIRWRAFLSKRRHRRLEDSYRMARRMVKMTLARRLLHSWHNKTATISDMKVQAEQQYDEAVLRRVAHPAIEYMYDKSVNQIKFNALAGHTAFDNLKRRGFQALVSRHAQIENMTQYANRLFDNRIQRVAHQAIKAIELRTFEAQQREASADAFRARHDKQMLRQTLGKMRVILAERRGGDEGFLALLPAPAVTPARRRGELLLDSSTRLSTTPAYTPFAARLRAEPRILDIAEVDDEDEEGSGTRAVEGESEE